MCLVFLLLALVLPSFATTFSELEGRTADPCNANLVAGSGGQDCNSVPLAQSTVLVPSETSTHPSQSTIQSGSYVMTVTGSSFDTTATYTFGLSTSAGSCVAIDTETGVVNSSSMTTSEVTFLLPVQWATVDVEVEPDARLLCVSEDGGSWYRYTGFAVKTVWHCDTLSGFTCAPDTSSAFYAGLTDELRQEIATRTTCCLSSLGMVVGQCIASFSPNGLATPYDCCGGSNITTAVAQCCKSTSELSAYITDACSCSSANATCESGEDCCLSTDGSTGQCYDNASYSCCETGVRYQMGVEQCCGTNGVVAVTETCSCTSDSECPTDQDCCSDCNTTTGGLNCTGECVDSAWQVCCSGVACAKAFQSCCGGTCCNDYSSACETGRASQVMWPTGQLAAFERAVCTDVDGANPMVLLWAYVYPSLFLLVTLVVTVLAMVFANKATHRSFSFVEVGVMVFAVLAILLSLPFYFSPAFKYSLVVAVAQLITIFSAAARIKRLNVCALALNSLLLFYVVDPFTGNAWFTLASGRLIVGAPDPETSGLLMVLHKMYYEPDFCSQWYLGYFVLDSALLDYDTVDNPMVTRFGFCNAGYVAFLLVFAVLLMAVVMLQWLSVLMILLLRFARPTIELELRQQSEDEVDDEVYSEPDEIMAGSHLDH